MDKKTRINGQNFMAERSLYGIGDTEVTNCVFAGEEDGESPLKETHDISVSSCKFDLRYPLWHSTNAEIVSSSFSSTSRAGFWYDKNISISDSKLLGIKALRECSDITVKNCEIVSPEFGWRCSSFFLSDSSLESEYPFFECKDLTINGLTMKGKYSFQYVKNLHLSNSHLYTKDAFWHVDGAIIENCIIEGEYLAWYSKNLTFRNCTIIGTQPFCYCKGLVLENCTMEKCDLSFERSEFNATLKGHLDSIKNPKKGFLKVDSIGELIEIDPKADVKIETK